MPGSGVKAMRANDPASAAAVALPTRRRQPQLSTTRRVTRLLSFRNISAIYVFAVIFVVFSLWVPDTFLTVSTWKTILDGQAVTALLAVGLVVALSAGAFDLAIGAELGLGSVLVAYLLTKGGTGTVSAIVLTIAAGVAVGIVQGLLIVRVRIDSFIATLGVSSILLALVSWVTNGQQLLGLSTGFQNLAQRQVFGITLPVYIMLVVGAVVWYLLDKTAVGRHLYATGGNIEAARLAGVRTPLVIIGALAGCGAIAAFSGVLVSGELSAGDPTIGPPYLLPAFSAAFLGSTQFRGGRFNVWGAIVAVYVLATGVKGLQLAGAAVWVPDLFNGAALLIAVGLAKQQSAAHRTGAIRRLLRFDRAVPTGAQS